ncbi:MAG TPA: AMP-binding protein, partial [Vicinamibacterales bacterium]|nr:AMP-binding protein [Vicinamibacterales bacterium]
MWNFCSRIADAAGRFADRTAIELLHDGRITETSYAGLMDGAARAAAWLGGVGVGAGERVAILADNEARWISAYLGTLWIGAVAVPLDTAYTAAQVATVVGNCQARVLFTSERLRDVATAAASVS